MTTIAAENRKTLRQALKVQCGFTESTENPTDIEILGGNSVTNGIANFDLSRTPGALMDLAGPGFTNDGTAEPIEANSESKRYGVGAESIAAEDGVLPTPMQVNVTAANTRDEITLEIVDQDGNSQLSVYDNLTWHGGKTEVLVERAAPNVRSYVRGVFLGKKWEWDNSNIISVNLDLRSVSTEINGELELSSIEIQVYEPNDITSKIGYFPIGAPIWYSAGYEGDMSKRRNFYLSDDVTQDNNIITIKGNDAVGLLENKEVPAKVGQSYGYTDRQKTAFLIRDRLRDALSYITFDEKGSVSDIGTSGTAYWYFDAQAPRPILAEFCDLFRLDGYIKPTFVDAGIPTLYLNDAVIPSWTIYADEISNLNVIVEHNVNEVEGKLINYSHVATAQVGEEEATAGDTYFIDLDNPASTAYASPTPASQSLITPTQFKFVAAATTTYTIYADQYVPTETNYSVNDSSIGITREIEDTMIFDTSDGSLTKMAMAGLLSRSNIKYEFIYRGNPHIQPRDVLNVQIATWKEVDVVLDGLYPDVDLYPGADIYPNAVYKTMRKMFTEWVTMTVDTVTLEHSSGGGLTSKILARKGTV